MTGIYLVRKHIKNAYFDLNGTKEGINALDNYKKKWSQSEGRFIDEPDKSNGATEGADSFRQWAQAKELGMIESASSMSTYQEPPPPDWRL